MNNIKYLIFQSQSTHSYLVSVVTSKCRPLTASHRSREVAVQLYWSVVYMLSQFCSKCWCNCLSDVNRRATRNFSWGSQGVGFNVEELFPQVIFTTPKNVSFSYILAYMEQFSESNGKREFGSRPCLLKPFVCLFHFYLQNFCLLVWMFMKINFHISYSVF